MEYFSALHIPNAPPISAPFVGMLIFTMPQSDPLGLEKKYEWQNFITACKLCNFWAGITQYTSLLYINRSLISFYPNPLKQIASSMNYSIFCTKCIDMRHTVHFYSRSINYSFLGCYNAPYPIHLKTAFMSFVNRLLDRPCLTSLLILKASSRFCKTHQNRVIYTYVHMKNPSFHMTSTLAIIKRNISILSTAKWRNLVECR